MPAASPPAFQLRTLGGLDLVSSNGDKVDAVLRQPKRAALLIYLAVARPGPFHQRESLMALFWPELDESRARHALNNGLYHLRTHLGRQAVASRGRTEVGVAVEMLRCDAAAFRDGCAGAGRREALRLYQGEFLAGFHPDVSRELDEWIEEERRGLRSLARDTALEEARSASSSGNHREAMFWASRAETIDPSSEEVVRTVLGLLDRAGERSLALEKFREFKNRLAMEFDAQPSPETERAVQLIRSREAGWKSYRDERPTPAALDDMVRPLSGGIEPKTADDLAELVDTLPDAVYRVDIHGFVRWTNQEGQRLLGYSLEELRRLRYMDLVRDDFREQLLEFLLRQIEERRAFSYIEYPMVSRDGKELWIGQTTRLVEKDGEILGTQGIVRYIGTRKRREESQRGLAQLDFETQVLSRRAFQLLAEHEGARSTRSQRPFSVLLLSVRPPEGGEADYLAVDGEANGRDAGAALRALVEVLRADSRDCDVLARYRGDALTLLLPETVGEEAAMVKARLQPHIERAAAPWRVAVDIHHWHPADSLPLEALFSLLDGRTRG